MIAIKIQKEGEEKMDKIPINKRNGMLPSFFTGHQNNI